MGNFFMQVVCAVATLQLRFFSSSSMVAMSSLTFLKSEEDPPTVVVGKRVGVGDGEDNKLLETPGTNAPAASVEIETKKKE